MVSVDSRQLANRQLSNVSLRIMENGNKSVDPESSATSNDDTLCARHPFPETRNEVQKAVANAAVDSFGGINGVQGLVNQLVKTFKEL